MSQTAPRPHHSLCLLAGWSNSHSLSPEGQDPNPDRNSVSFPAPTPHAVSSQYPRGSGLHPHSTHRCLSVQEETPVAWWLRQCLGRCLQNLGYSHSLACGFWLAWAQMSFLASLWLLDALSPPPCGLGASGTAPASPRGSTFPQCWTWGGQAAQAFRSSTPRTSVSLPKSGELSFKLQGSSASLGI